MRRGRPATRSRVLCARERSRVTSSRPAWCPVRPGDRVKIDPRDARKLVDDVLGTGDRATVEQLEARGSRARTRSQPRDASQARRSLDRHKRPLRSCDQSILRSLGPRRQDSFGLREKQRCVSRFSRPLVGCDSTTPRRANPCYCRCARQSPARRADATAAAGLQQQHALRRHQAVGARSTVRRMRCSASAAARAAVRSATRTAPGGAVLAYPGWLCAHCEGAGTRRRRRKRAPISVVPAVREISPSIPAAPMPASPQSKPRSEGSGAETVERESGE